MKLTTWNSVDPKGDLMERAASFWRTARKFRKAGHELSATRQELAACRLEAAAEKLHELEADGWHLEASRCDCGGSGWRPGIPDDECCPFHGIPQD